MQILDLEEILDLVTIAIRQEIINKVQPAQGTDRNKVSQCLITIVVGITVEVFALEVLIVVLLEVHLAEVFAPAVAVLAEEVLVAVPAVAVFAPVVEEDNLKT